MVYLILTRKGFDDIHPLLDDDRIAVWINGGLLSDDAVSTLRLNGLSLTVYAEQMEFSVESIAGMVADIELHHPHESIWVEAISGS